MDERYWWILSRIQHSFSVRVLDEPNVFATHLRREKLEIIRSFLEANGPKRLFVIFCSNIRTATVEDVRLTTNPAEIADAYQFNFYKIIYFLRYENSESVSVYSYEKEIFYGEINSAILENLNDYLTDVVLPCSKVRNDWGLCTGDQKLQILQSLEKYSAAISEASTSSSKSSHQRILEMPAEFTITDFKATRQAAQNEDLVLQYEQLVQQWMHTIDATVLRIDNATSQEAGPLAELDRWRRRHRTLTSLTEQLKSKECKNVIGVLITAKSKLLKQWKSVDISITDAVNDTRDKVKYLESLKKYLEDFYSPSVTPGFIVNQTLPSLISTMKQMDSASRYYCKSGFMGLIFCQIANQVVACFKDYIKALISPAVDEDELWKVVFAEAASSSSADYQDQPDRLIRSHFEQKLTQGRVTGKSEVVFDIKESTVIGRVKACLLAQRLLRVALKHFREAVGLGQTASAASSNSSRQQQQQQQQLAGFSIFDEDAIFNHMEEFSKRLRQFLDIHQSLSQVFHLKESTRKLPRPRKEDLEIEDDNLAAAAAAAANTAASTQKTAAAAAKRSSDGLEAIHEDSEVGDEVNNDEDNNGGASAAAAAAAAEDLELVQSILVMKNYYDSEGEGPSVAKIITKFADQLTHRVDSNISSSTLLDIDSKDKDKFCDVYKHFLQSLTELEQFAVAYIHTIFQWKFYPLEALQVLQAFQAISHRQQLRAAVTEKYIEIFGQFEGHLNDIKELYELNKHQPPRVRNAPPVAGAVSWARQLWRQIEMPMRIFKQIPEIAAQPDYNRTVKMFNKVATALTAFEQLFLNQWKAKLTSASESLKSTLFIRHPQTGEILVNLDEKVLELMQESKWLIQLGVQLPESALSVMQLQPRIKNYYHNLTELLQWHQETLNSITKELKDLFSDHLRVCASVFQPGLSNLAWNSTNIDGFLHLLRNACNNLRATVVKVNEIMQQKVHQQLGDIGAALLFHDSVMFSKSWLTTEFPSNFDSTCHLKQDELQQKVKLIESGLSEIITILSSKTNTSKSIKSSSLNTMSKAPTTAAAAAAAAAASTESAAAAAALQQHYKQQLSEALLSAVTRTLVTLAESSGVEGSPVLTRLSSAIWSRPQSRAAASASSKREDSDSYDDSRERVYDAAADVLLIEDYRREKVQASAALTAVSKFSSPIWCDTELVTYLRFRVFLRYCVPLLVIEPELEQVQKCLSDAAVAVLKVVQGLSWSDNSDFGKSITQEMQSDNCIKELCNKIGCVTEDLWSRMRQLIIELSKYDFLWKDNLQSNLNDYMQSSPTNEMLSSEVDRLMQVQQRICSISSEYTFGCVALQTQPVVDVLEGFVLSWKEAYAFQLHARVKADLDAAVSYRLSQQSRLQKPVASLDDLSDTLHLLEELRDMENKIDEIYLPIERLYAKLQSYDLRLPRSEIEECQSLRFNWQELMQLADDKRFELLRKRRSHFEQELDKQVKSFVVEVIQFRNQFDAQGPFVPNIEPLEAVERLKRFQQVYELHASKRRTLDSVSKLFGVVVRRFDELDRTNEELKLLNLLYDLFQKFIAFDKRFREEFWIDVDLEATSAEVEGYWDESLALPSSLRSWDAHIDMKSRMHRYRQLLPLLRKLNSREIRSRHWTQVMQIVDCNFPLESTAFKLKHLLDIDLLNHHPAVEEVCRSAHKEQELELKMKQIEEEWTEQVLSFLHYKRKGPVLLDKSFTERLLEQLEHSQTELAVMLTSPHVAPLREEAANWAEKLKDIFHVLELWVEVQELWQDLEAVFSNADTAKELPQEAKRFERVDRSYVKTMQRAHATKNVLQCCIGGDVSKFMVLKHVNEELQLCFKSLNSYLDQKRVAFPRFSFVSNSILLSILRRPRDLATVRPQLNNLFTAVADVRTEQKGSEQQQQQQQKNTSGSAKNKRSSLNKDSIDESQQQIMEENEKLIYEIVSVISENGDELQLDKKVTLQHNVEQWLAELQQNIGDTLERLSQSVIADINACGPLDELAHRYPSQICRLGLLYYWTKECEHSVNDIRNDRKAVQNVTKKFCATMTRLPTILMRGSWKTIDEQMLPVHKFRLSSMITEAYYLRECMENMITKKVKDGQDFEWRRNVRCYAREEESTQIPSLYFLDQSFPIGREFMGIKPILAPTPMTDRCFLAMALGLRAKDACLVQGPSGCGKTETVRGLAHILCQHICVTHARSGFDAGALSKIVQGVVSDGCWSLMDEAQHLPDQAVGVMVDLVRVALNAARAASRSCVVGDGVEVPVKQSLGFIITYNPFTKSAGELSKEIRTQFRPVSLSRPNLLQILKMKCLAMQFKSPIVLATRLKVTADLAMAQLPNESRNNFGITSMFAILGRADQIRRLENEKELSRQDSTLAPSAGQNQGAASSEIWPPFRERTEVIMNRATGQKMPTFTNKKSTANVALTPSAKQEHSAVKQAILEIIEPRIRPQNQEVLRQIVSDLFVGLPASNASATVRKTSEILERIGRVCQEKGLSPSRHWLEKCIQIWHISAVQPGVVLAGPAGGGKSTAVEALVAALAGMATKPEESHRLQRIYPMAVEDLSSVFGQLLPNGQWQDGVFTSAFRKANRNQSATWLMLDGGMTSAWTDNFNSLLESESMLHLKNGDQLRMGKHVRIVFETDCLDQASPAVLNRAGIVFFDPEQLGWRPIANAWLRQRLPHVAHTLKDAFDKTLDILIPWTQSEVRPVINNCSSIGAFQSCLALLQAMLDEHQNHLSGSVHIERLFLFALVWSFGALLEGTDRLKFSNKLKDLSSALPDDDREICIFDYYVDDSGEWDPWISRVPEQINTDEMQLTGRAFVDTVDTVRAEMLLDLANRTGRHALLVGCRGSGKTTVARSFIQRLDSQQRVMKNLVFSGATSAGQLQRFVESNIVHRQGFVYGAREGKRLLLCIEDLAQPRPDRDGVQRCSELVRQLCDTNLLITQSKPFEWRHVEGLDIVASAAIGGSAALPESSLQLRMLRHFVLINFPAFAGQLLRCVARGVLEAQINHDDRQAMDIELLGRITEASSELLEHCQAALQLSPLAGRRHYLFNIKDLSECFVAFRRLPDERRIESSDVMAFWCHEVRRVFADRICRTADQNWFGDTLASVCEKHFPDVSPELREQLFITFDNDKSKFDSRPNSTQVNNSGRMGLRISRLLPRVQSFAELRECLQAFLTRFNEEEKNEPLELTLSDSVIEHIVRAHRCLSQAFGGHLLQVGSIGCKLTTLCRLAIYMLDVKVQEVDTKSENAFFDSIRAAVRMAGLDGCHVALVVSMRSLDKEVFLDAINSLIACGEYPQLFNNEEYDTLLQALLPTIKKENQALLNDPQKFFLSRLRECLHFVLCAPPSSEFVQRAAQLYPCLLKHCHVNWLCDWEPTALRGEAAYFLEGNKELCQNGELASKTVEAFTKIHSFVLREFHQIACAGEQADSVEMMRYKLSRGQLKQDQVTVPNKPYSKLALMEHIKQRHVSQLPTEQLPLGPTHFKRMLQTFDFLFSSKCEERHNRVSLMRQALTTLAQCRHDETVMVSARSQKQQEFKDACKEAEKVLAELTVKVTKLEKIRARSDPNCPLTHFLKMHDFHSEEEQEDPLLSKDDFDKYDEEFDRIREETVKNRHNQVKEDLQKAKDTYASTKSSLENARKEVNSWRNKVDRNCVERIRAFQNPPALVGQVMEMVFILIGKLPPTASRFAKEDTNFLGNDRNSIGSAGPQRRQAVQKDERVDRSTWKSMQFSMSDSVKFVEMLHHISWEDGLEKDVLRSVESYLAKSKEGQLGVTGEGSLLEGGENIEKIRGRRDQSPGDSGPKGISISQAKYSSEDAATLVHYTIALVEYSRLCGPLRESLERVKDLEREIRESQQSQQEREEEANAAKQQQQQAADEELKEEDLPEIQAEVERLRSDYDEVILKKHRLQSETDSMSERLKKCRLILQNLQPIEAKWKLFANENSSNDVLLTNCVCAAAFLIYCGGLSSDSRCRISMEFIEICRKCELPPATKQLFRDQPLIEFLFKEADIEELQLLRLPMTSLQLENASFLMLEQHCNTWPLICDATRAAVTWLQNYQSCCNVVEVQYHNLRTQLEGALSDGAVLIVTDCDVERLADDARFRPLLLQQHKFMTESFPFKILLVDHEVECSPKFRLFLHTSAQPADVPQHLAASTNLLLFHQTRSCIEESLLDRFLLVEKARVEREWRSIVSERLQTRRTMFAIEEAMVEKLGVTQTRLMNDLDLAAKLQSLQRQMEETQAALERVEESELLIRKSRESHRDIARRGAVCFEVTAAMQGLNAMYCFSYQELLRLYDVAMQHSDRIAVQQILERLTWSIHQHTCCSLLETDRSVYRIALATEISDSSNSVLVGEREFVISPSFGAEVVRAAGKLPERSSNRSDEGQQQQQQQQAQLQRRDEKREVETKRPDWMSEEAFANLQLLNTHFAWFNELYNRINNTESAWRALIESAEPEGAPLPDRAEEHLRPMQRLCIVRAVRPDRLMQASYAFIAKVMGIRYIGDCAADVAAAAAVTGVKTPILLLYEREAELCDQLVTQSANKQNKQLLTLRISEDSAQSERSAKRMMQRALTHNCWLLLHTTTAAAHVALRAASTLANEAQIELKECSDYRLLIAAEFSDQLPLPLLQLSVKLVIDSPTAMRDSILRNWSLIDPSLLKVNPRSEWSAALHNLTLAHSVLQLRARISPNGFNRPEDVQRIGAQQFLSAIRLMEREFKDEAATAAAAAAGSRVSKQVNYQTVKCLLHEVVYGAALLDAQDVATVGAVIDFWLSQASLRKDFELPKLKYRIPSIFFGSQNSRHQSLLQAIESAVPPFTFDTAEACHLQMTDETNIGIDHYVFTRLNLIFDKLPASTSLSHQLFERPPTPIDGPAICNIGPSSTKPTVAALGLVATGSHAALKHRKALDLMEVCHSALVKVTQLKPITIESVIARIEKIGGSKLPFNVWLRREFDSMQVLLNCVRDQLQELKQTLLDSESENFGDSLSPAAREVADALLQQQLPPGWLQLCGAAAPPVNYPIASFIADVAARQAQLDKLLTLGRAKMPAYNLSLLQQPTALLSMLAQDFYAQQCRADKTLNVEQLYLTAELTSRDRDHIREPPTEGIFVFGLYLWNCGLEKTSWDLSDQPPKLNGYSPMPVIQLSYSTQEAKLMNSDPLKLGEIYNCPVYMSRQSREGNSLFELELKREGASASKWALKGVQVTLRPF